MNSQWKEPICHPSWGSERCLLRSAGGQAVSSAAQGLTGEYRSGGVRTGLQLCIYNWHFQACSLILRKHNFVLFKKKHQKMNAFKTIFFFFFLNMGGEIPPLQTERMEKRS